MTRYIPPFNYHLEIKFNNSSLVFKTMYPHFLLIKKTSQLTNQVILKEDKEIRKS